jgi:hypothetical protein
MMRGLRCPGALGTSSWACDGQQSAGGHELLLPSAQIIRHVLHYSFLALDTHIGYHTSSTPQI